LFDPTNPSAVKLVWENIAAALAQVERGMMHFDANQYDEAKAAFEHTLARLYRATGNLVAGQTQYLKTSARACRVRPPINRRATKQPRLKPVLSPKLGTLLCSTAILWPCERGKRRNFQLLRLDSRLRGNDNPVVLKHLMQSGARHSASLLSVN
jgi:hypothetical protein